MTVQRMLEILKQKKPEDVLLVEDWEGNLSYLLDVADDKEGFVTLVAKDRVIDESELYI